MFTLDKRPQLLSEMIDSKKSLNEIKNRSKDINFDPYNIFYGSTGIGKSTAVFITAKLLNCSAPVMNIEGYYDPCNECASCKDIIEGKYNRDVHYLDASHMGKEEVKQLSALISRYAMYDKNKIIIIDEAHLLASKEAKSAMLLLTEKLRKNAYLFLCTTQPKKIPKDLFTRFTQYEFRRPALDEIVAYMLQFMIDQKLFEQIPGEVEFSTEALMSIAFNADGSIRQALRILERCIYAQAFTVDQIKSSIGLTDENGMKEATWALLDKSKTFLRTFFEYKDENNLEDLFTYMLNMVNKAIIFKLLQNSKVEVLQEWEDNYYKLGGMAKQSTLEEVQRLFLKVEEKRNAYYFSASFFLSLILDYFNSSTGGQEVPLTTRRRIVS